MADREARALGVGGIIEVGDQEYTLSPLSIGALEELQRMALRSYKKSYLETYSQNRELLGDGVFEQKLEQVASWDISDLPHKTAYDVSNVPVTPELKEELTSIYGTAVLSEGTENRTFSLVLSSALDEKKITSQRVKELTGVAPDSGQIRYDLWWVTGTYEGMIHFIAKSIQTRHPNMGPSDVAKWDLRQLLTASKITERLTAPAVKNT